MSFKFYADEVAFREQTDRQARMAAIVAPFLESRKILLRLLSGDTDRYDEHREQHQGSKREEQ